MGFPQVDFAAADSGAVELDDLNFRRLSFPLEEFAPGWDTAMAACGAVTSLGPALDIRSESLHELVPDIPDVMGLRPLRPDAAAVKVMSVRDSRCIRVVTPDDHVACGYHEILLHDMGEEELPLVSLSELDYLRRIWLRALGLRRSLFPRAEVDALAPAPRAHRAASYMSAMGLWHPQKNPNVPGPVPASSCHSCMNCKYCFPEHQLPPE